MKQSVLILVVFLILVSAGQTRAIAQSGKLNTPKISLGGSVLFALPQGSFKEAYGFGLGGELVGGVGLGSTYVLGSIGITGYKPRSGFSNTLSALPVKVGIKKYFLLKRIFIQGDLGVSTIKVSGESAKAFTAGYGGGVRLIGFEAGLYYNAFKNNIGYSTKGFSNSVQLKIGWTL
jgi:hypothetical protein